MNARNVYEQSDGSVTMEYYRQLESRGVIGIVAMNLFRAQKCSVRAKGYYKYKHKAAAYDRKNWSMQNLCRILGQYAEGLKIVWGWKVDHVSVGFEHVLYVDLPTGQCSFHSATRMECPEYLGEWDRNKGSEQRIINFCDQVFKIGALPETV